MKKHRSHQRRINNKYKYGERSLSPSGKFFFFGFFFLIHMFNTNGIFALVVIVNVFDSVRCLEFRIAIRKYINVKMGCVRAIGHFLKSIIFNEFYRKKCNKIVF